MKFISSLLLSLSLSRFACLAADQHVEKVLKVTRKKKGNMAGTNSAKRLHFKLCLIFHFKLNLTFTILNLTLFVYKGELTSHMTTNVLNNL